MPAGYGATDDGMGVVSILQLIRFYTTQGNQPKKGLVALLNNGEEDYLNGARAFALHPISNFPRAFLNLEGAGAGGRAALFRSTDAEVTRYYRGTPSPQANVIMGDAFQQGFVRSQTDYIIFNGDLGMRGLDVAFFDPRARYHTSQDDTRHTSIDSLWHMLSAGLHTTGGLTSDSEATFESGKGSHGVWFDVLGDSFVLFRLHSLFAVSVTLLVVAPLAVATAGAFASKAGKFYLFSFAESIHQANGDQSVSLGGFRGFFRFPFIFFIPTAVLVGLAFLVTKFNPFVAYSSPYAIWSMMLSAWLFMAWFLSKASDFVRPSAFHRAYSWLWMFVIFWALLVAFTVYEDRLGIASGYFIVWYFLVISLATFISFLEQFRLETKQAYAARHQEEANEHLGEARGSGNRRPGSNAGSNRLSLPAGTDDEGVEEDGEEATESTSLLRTPKTTTFANYTSSIHDHDRDTDSSIETKHPSAYEYEQDWSRYLPSWLWIVQFLIVAPITVLIVGQIGLQLVTASYQTLADGSSPLVVYLIIAVFSVLILAPIAPFLHRLTYHVPTFLLLVAVGTLVYNLIAFPFSSNNRLKLYFVQRVDLDTDLNEVGLSGIEGSYLEDVVHSLPSAAGRNVSKHESSRRDLVEYVWEGIPPRFGYNSWLSFNATRLNSTNEARFIIRGLNTRNCKLLFDEPISDFNVHGSAVDPRFTKMPDSGSKEIRLWTRRYGDTLTVDAKWAVSEEKHVGRERRSGKVVCLWNDDGHGHIEALEEVRRFAPTWVAVANLGNGLVEASKAFTV